MGQGLWVWTIWVWDYESGTMSLRLYGLGTMGRDYGSGLWVETMGRVYGAGTIWFGDYGSGTMGRNYGLGTIWIGDYRSGTICVGDYMCRGLYVSGTMGRGIWVGDYGSETI